MRILVTGATGFVGNYVIQELLSKTKHQIIASGHNEERAKKYSWYGQVTYIPYNLANIHQDETSDLFNYFQKPDLLIHLAWRGLPDFKGLFHIEEHLMTQYFFLNNLIKNGLTQLAITGTCFELGKQEGCLSEETQPRPNTPYSVAKDSLRRFLEQLQLQNPFSMKWIRLFYTYGKGQSEKSILPQLEKAIANKETHFNMSGGEQIRDYLPVEQFAEYIVTIALQNKVQGIINCCSGNPVKLKDMVLKVIKEKQSTIQLNLGVYPYLDYEPMAFWGDTQKMAEALNA
ncbi:MAG: NAD(P)-dependent oxidoreductase [Phycisphaerales bacterium]|nr:NAD(P)-dependent oxidoreductase [Phycisphaerales bacterium]